MRSFVTCTVHRIFLGSSHGGWEWARHVERIGEMKNAYRSLDGKPEDLGVDGRIILEWVLGKWVGRCGVGSSGSG